MDVGKVDEDGDIGLAGSDGLLEFAELAVDAGQMAHDLRNSHHRHILRADDELEAGIGHAWAAHAEEAGGLAAGGELCFRASMSSAP